MTWNEAQKKAAYIRRSKVDPCTEIKFKRVEIGWWVEYRDKFGRYCTITR